MIRHLIRELIGETDKGSDRKSDKSSDRYPGIIIEWVLGALRLTHNYIVY